MSSRTLRRCLIVYGVVLFVVCVGVRQWFVLSPAATEVVIESWWQNGARVGRVARGGNVTIAPKPQTSDPSPMMSVGREAIVADAALSMSPLLFVMGLVPGRDGVSATLDGKTAYATVDDLMVAQAYDRAHLWVEASFGWGTHRATVLDLLAKDLGVSAQELTSRAVFRRVRFERREWTPPPGIQRLTRPLAPRPARLDADNLTRAIVLDGVNEAATHLAGLVDGQGNFRYTVDAPTNKTLPGYNWPRHAGATYFLAQAAGVLSAHKDDIQAQHLSSEPDNIQLAALRAAMRLRDQMIHDCGAERCVVPDEPIAEIGSSALTLIAFVELVRTERLRSSKNSPATEGPIGTSFKPSITWLASFLRSQQRPDGELMHMYDRQKKQPIDVQYLYFTGEAALALARAYTITENPLDLEAAKRALERLSGAGWSFFGSRYFFGEEHWTCQAASELWESAPNPRALEFCARWHEYQRRLQQDADETPFDSEGSFGFGPLVSPRVTPASSRGEAAGALAAILHRQRSAGKLRPDDPELALVDRELRRALAFVLRSQFHPGPGYLFADANVVRGGVPGSTVDWQLRIDYAQHAGSMMIRFLEVDDLAKRTH